MLRKLFKEKSKLTKEQKREIRNLKREEKILKQYDKLKDANKFKQWRNKRPFWGATLTIIAGLSILYIPLHLYAIAFIPGSLVFIGFLFGGLTLIIGILSYLFPQFSTVFGTMTLFLSILSIMGALGGFLIGTILGIVAGSLCIAWQEEDVNPDYIHDSYKEKRNEKTVSIEEKAANTIQM